MAFRDDIVAFSNFMLELDKYPDYGPMGLQFAGDEFVDKIACAVSVSKDVIEKTHEMGAQMLIVHHGMFWNNESRILDDRVGGRLELLEKYGISLLGYHLALDANPNFGNNIRAAKTLGLGKIKPFDIGFGGQYRNDMGCDVFINLVHRVGYSDILEGCFHHPSKRVSRVAVIVGGAAQYIVEAHRQGYDTFFTGEMDEPTMYMTQDLEMNFVAGGHDRTERAGVQQLSKIICRKFPRTKWEFIPVDNPV